MPNAAFLRFIQISIGNVYKNPNPPEWKTFSGAIKALMCIIKSLTSQYVFDVTPHLFCILFIHDNS